MSLTRLSLLTLLAVALLHAAPVAVVSTGGALKINNNSIPTTGAPTWPLKQGDEVVTAADPAVITVQDGSRFTMGKNTRVVIKKCDRCVVQLFEGTLAFKMPDSPTAQVCALGHPVKPDALTEGTITIENAEKVVVQVVGKEQVQIAKGQCACDAAAPWLTSKKKAALILLAGGGATATTLAVTRPDKKSRKKENEQ